MKRILYLHGFNSAPASHKASQLGAYLQERGRADAFLCPALPHRPAQAMQAIEDLVGTTAADDLTVVGSSLGGFYATWLTEKFGFRSVLINPGVFAYASLAPHVGPQTNLYTGERYEFTQQHIAELQALAVPAPRRLDRYWLMVESGDATLDYREAVAYYRGVRQLIIAGGDHGFAHWSVVQPGVVRHAGVE